MFGIGETELIIIVVFAIMVFGPDKLPGMGRTIGRVLRQFREAQEGFSQVVQAEVVDPMNEAMNEPSARKRAQAAAVAQADDADLDADLPEGGAPRRTETFAERKARLAAEREAREAAAQGVPAEAGGDAAVPVGEASTHDAGRPATTAEAAGTASPEATSASAPAESTPSAGEAPERGDVPDGPGRPTPGPAATDEGVARGQAASAPDTSAAALYALTPRRGANEAGPADAEAEASAAQSAEPAAHDDREGGDEGVSA